MLNEKPLRRSAFFWILDQNLAEHAKVANMGNGDACQFIEIQLKDHGGEILDRMIDKLIEEGEWPETIQ